MKNIKKGFKKYIKGMFGIFMIKLCIVSLILVYQACQTEEYMLPETEAKENFLAGLRNGTTNLSKIKANKAVFNHGFLSAREGLGTVELDTLDTTICTKEPIIPTNTNDGDASTEITLSDFISLDLKSIEEVEEDSVFDDNCYTFNNVEVENAMQPTLNSSLEYLRANGFTDELIIEELGNLNNTKIIAAALIVYDIVEDESSTVDNSQNINFFGNSVYAQGTMDYIDCALSALGLPAGLVLGTAKNLKFKTILKTVLKLSGRVIGWVGMAIAVYQFARCVQQFSSTAFINIEEIKFEKETEWKQLT